MKILLDFDYTMLNTDLLREAIFAAFYAHGVNRELFLETLEESRGNGRDWKPERQFAILEARGVGDITFLRQNFEAVLAGCRTFLFEDTMPFLEKAKKDHKLCIISYGEDSFQDAKFQGCGSLFLDYFDPIVITQNIAKDKEAGELAGSDEAMFVEDNPLALRAAKKYAPHIVTVRINRGVGRYAREPSGEGVDYEVKDLREVEELISRLARP